jgi:two-component sensor histidine kinase
MPLVVGLCLWLGLAGLFAIQGIVADSESPRMAITKTWSFWQLWALFLPVTVWLSLRFPLMQPKLLPQVPIHLLACGVIVGTIQVACHTVIKFEPPKPVSPGMRVVPDVMIYLLTMSGCVAFAHSRRSQERERRAIELEARLTRARLQALQMQINPHFLFNTLNAISTLVHTSPATADDMITDLADLFRATLESSDEQEIQLARELELLQRYLAIEQRRFGTRLQIEQRVAPDLLGARVPTLILQPLVENAIRHGIESRSDGGRILIAAQREGQRLKLAVSDNGKKTLDLSRVEKTAGRQHVGLANVRARLKQLYGDGHALDIRQGELGGWTVEITLPLQLAAVEPK